jgi:hypothetical protein
MTAVSTQRAGTAGALLVWAALACADDAPSVPEPPRFTPVQPDLFGAGGALTDAWADIDGDGDPDRFVGFNGAPSRLYRNDRESGFQDVAPTVGLAVERAIRTAAWGDFDADGDPDLLLGFAGDAPVTALYRNDWPEGFRNVAADAGLELARGATRQASWIDYDGDLDLDLFLALRDRANRLFRNDGSGTFTDVTEATGIGDTRRTVGAIWMDFDSDLDLDLITANMNGDGNGMWLNEGGRFIDIGAGTPVESGGRALGDETQGSVRVCAADVDREGQLDLFFANYGPNGLFLWDNRASWASGPETPSLAIDSMNDTCIWGDIDHDGWIDLYLNGTITGGVQHRDWLFRREGGREFLDRTPPELLELSASHGATWVDFDLDGDLDLALAGVAEDGMHYLMRNELDPVRARRSLQVRVLDASGAAVLPGAEVRLVMSDAGLVTVPLGARLVDSGSGYNAQSDLPVHFGLPEHGLVDVEIWVPRLGRSGLYRVDPADYEGSVLTVLIDRNGATAASPGASTGRPGPG